MYGTSKPPCSKCAEYCLLPVTVQHTHPPLCKNSYLKDFSDTAGTLAWKNFGWKYVTVKNFIENIIHSQNINVMTEQ